MSKWPWPQAEVDFFIDRATRVMEDHPQRHAVVRNFLISLALPDSSREPVRELRKWTRGRSQRRLRQAIEEADLHRIAVAAAGVPSRRGDIVQLRTKPSWWDVRQ